MQVSVLEQASQFCKESWQLTHLLSRRVVPSAHMQDFPVFVKVESEHLSHFVGELHSEQ